MLRIVRQLHQTGLLRALNSDAAGSRTRTKVHEIASANNLHAKSKLQAVEQRHPDILRGVSKVIDLGFAPGNWTEYLKGRLMRIHGLEERNFVKKCHLLGFDLLYATPPHGVSTIQGNIYSKFAHELMANHFKDVALEEFRQSDSTARTEIEELALSLAKVSLDKLPQDLVEQSRLQREKYLEGLEHRVDLICSDLSSPFRQMDGFYSMTQSRPHQRINTNPALFKVFKEPHNSSLDMTDAALLLACNMLKPGGRFIARLSHLILNDDEIDLVREKLESVFRQVDMTQVVERKHGDLLVGEVMCVCRGRLGDGEFDVRNVF